MQLKSVGLIIIERKITLKIALSGILGTSQMEKLTKEFYSIFSRLGLYVKVSLQSNNLPMYIITKKIKDNYENIPENYIGYIKNQYDDIKEIIDTLDNLEDEIERFSKIQEVANGKVW